MKHGPVPFCVNAARPAFRLDLGSALIGLIVRSRRKFDPRTTRRSEPMDLNGKRIAILVTNGFEQSELEVARDRLIKAGAAVDVVSLASGEIKGWDQKDWGRRVKVDRRWTT
jgi:hypothetical protein